MDGPRAVFATCVKRDAARVNELPRVTDDLAAFPILEGSDLALLESLGTRRSVTPGEYLYRQWDVKGSGKRPGLLT